MKIGPGIRMGIRWGVGLALWGAHLHAASALYVAPEGDHSTGESWATALTNLQVAIDRIDPGGSIYLQGGTLQVTNQLVITNGVGMTIRGGYEGQGSPGPRDVARWPTVIRLEEGREGRVFYLEAADETTLEGLTITGGNVRGDTLGDSGGGLCISNGATVWLRDLVVSNNLAEKLGGGVSIVHTVSGANITLENCRMVSNRVDYAGSYAQGGGMYVYRGYGITLTNCVIQANNVHSTGPFGGGLSCTYATVTAYDTLFADNWLSGGAYFRGGAANVSSAARLYLRSCIVRNNRCLGGSNARGGAIHTSSSSSFSIRNTLFANNQAQGTYTYGGAICYYTGNDLTLDNCTFVGNSPSAIHRLNVYGSIELNNCILWNNQGQDIIDAGTTIKTTASHCDIQDGFNFGTNGCIRLDPLFMRPEAQDFSLRSASPCREAGMTLNWHEGATDLVGNPRVMPRHGVVDMGALEGMPVMATLFLLR